MEEFNYNPENIDSALRQQSNANAFLEMADEIQQEAPEPAPTQAEKAKVKNALNIGPKYLEALDHVMEMVDIRAIEIELPILRRKVEVTPLTGKEEQVLRSASVSPENFLNKVNEIIYKHVKFMDGEHLTYAEFLKNLFPPDKSILIWGLISASYLVLPTIEKQCEVCSENYIIEEQPDALFQEDTITNIWDKEESPDIYTEKQSVLNDYLTFEIGMPSELIRTNLIKLIAPENAKENLNKYGNILSFTDNIIFFTKAVIVGDDSDKIVLTNPIQDIYPFLKNLPPKAMDAIKSGIALDSFDKYMPSFYINASCSHCGASEKIYVDPEVAFFRKAVSL
jgi:hypothetical protein